MKQFLVPTPKQTYTIARDFKFLLYPFNLGCYDDKTHPFNGVYFESVYGKFNKKGEFKFTHDIVHGISKDLEGHANIWGVDKKKSMSLRECVFVVDSESEKDSKFLLPYNDKNRDWIFGNVPRENTYSIFTDFLNTGDNDSYSIPCPKPRDFKKVKEVKNFPKAVNKKELEEMISYYKEIIEETKEENNNKLKLTMSTYTLRVDKKIEQYIPIEYILPAGTEFKFMKFGTKPLRGFKKKNFVEMEINGHTVYVLEEDFSGIWVE